MTMLGIISCFEYFKKNREIPVGNAYVYDILFELGVFPDHTKEYKERIEKQAIQELKQEVHKSTMSTYKRAIENIENKIGIKSKCKEIALRELFTDYILAAVDIVSVLNEKGY